MTVPEGLPEERCPEHPECWHPHFWQRAAYRKKGWVSYRAPVKAATHPNLKFCPGRELR